MPKLFISYRRHDSADATGRLHDRLKAHFGEENVFYDVHSIAIGLDFRKIIGEEVGKCDVLLAVIGDNWVNASDDGQRRLDNPNDLVRIEIETALARDIPVVPVLVGNASMPAEADLPGDLKGLTRRNAATVRPGADFDDHAERLRTADRERKRIVRLLIEDVTLIKGECITAHIRFKGGATQSRTVPAPQPSWKTWLTNPEVMAKIDQLLDSHTEGEIAAILNDQNLRSGQGCLFTQRLVGQLRRAYRLKPRFDRLRKKGMLTVKEIAKELGVCTSTVNDWRRSGLLKASMCNDKHEYLYEPPGKAAPRKLQGIKYSDPRRFSQLPPDRTKEVQDEA